MISKIETSKFTVIKDSIQHSTNGSIKFELKRKDITESNEFYGFKFYTDGTISPKEVIDQLVLVRRSTLLDIANRKPDELKFNYSDMYLAKLCGYQRHIVIEGKDKSGMKVDISMVFKEMFSSVEMMVNDSIKLNEWGSIEFELNPNKTYVSFHVKNGKYEIETSHNEELKSMLDRFRKQIDTAISAMSVKDFLKMNPEHKHIDLIADEKSVAQVKDWLKNDILRMSEIQSERLQGIMYKLYALANDHDEFVVHVKLSIDSELN
jgi:hypothetical protein